MCPSSVLCYLPLKAWSPQGLRVSSSAAVQGLRLKTSDCSNSKDENDPLTNPIVMNHSLNTSPPTNSSARKQCPNMDMCGLTS